MKKPVVPAVVFCLVWIHSVAVLAENESSSSRSLTSAVGIETWNAGATLSWQTLGQTGNVQRYNKYVTPPTGLFLGGLSAQGFDREGFPLARLEVFDLGETDTGASLTLRGGGFPGSFQWDYNRYSFFADPLPTAAARAKRLTSLMRLNLALGGAAPEIAVRYRHQEVNEPTIARLGAGGLSFTSKDVSFGTSVLVGPGTLRLSYDRLDFTDRTGFLPDSVTDVWAGDYTLDLTRQLSFIASYYRSRLDQAGMSADMEVDAWQVSGHYQPTSLFGISGTVGERWVDQPMTATAYTRQTNTADVRAVYRLRPNVTLRAGYNRLDFERINRAHSAVDTPRRDTTWVKLRARLARGLRVSAKYKEQDLKGVPASGVVGTADTSPLYRNDKSSFDLRVTGPVGKLGQGYLFYTDDDVRNPSRLLHYEVETVGGGFFAQLTPRWSVTLDALTQNWDGLTNYSDVTGLALNAAPPGGVAASVGLPLTADQDVVSIGTSYVLDPETSVSFYYSKFKGTEGALIDDHEFGLVVRRALKNGASCGLEWRRAFYDNGNPRIGVPAGLDYADNVVRVDVTTSF